MSHIKIIFGLGNPGARYEHTYHNAGILFLHTLADDRNQNTWKSDTSFLSTRKENMILARSKDHFMNESGAVAQALLATFRAKPNTLLVVHDDHDLPIGTYKYAESGTGSAGHNGVQSIINAIGNTFPRIRIGISKRKNGDDHEKALQIVLERMTQEDRALIEETSRRAIRDLFS